MRLGKCAEDGGMEREYEERGKRDSCRDSSKLKRQVNKGRAGIPEAKSAAQGTTEWEEAKRYYKEITWGGGRDLVGLYALHEEVGDPQSIEEVPCTGLLAAMVLAEVQPLPYVSMPWLQVDGDCSLALATSLHDIGASFCLFRFMEKTDQRLPTSLIIPSLGPFHATLISIL